MCRIPSRWYANNCIFRPERMRFQFGSYIQEGDKTVVPFRHFLENFKIHSRVRKTDPRYGFLFQSSRFSSFETRL